MYNHSSSQIFTVSELTHQIRLKLESDFDGIWVEGEISNLRCPSSGHRYFTLKDANSQIKAVVFRSHARFLRFKVEDGLHMICRGRVSVYEPRGDYQIIIDYIEPKGVGALQLAYEQLKERLQKEGLFDDSSKKPLPLLPRKIGLITSPSGAAVRDMITIIYRRFPNVEILIVPIRVQGEGASLEIARALEEVNRSFVVDVIIVGRGGGSLEDLWAFNEEVTARAIYDSKIPVISAVGHEIDFTISDFVADLRAPTPSAAAELVVAKKSELLISIDHFRGRLKNLMSHLLESRQNRLNFLEKRLLDPRRRLDDFRLRVDDLDKEMDVRMTYYLGNLRHKFERYMEGLERLSPLNILQRGYSITRRLPGYNVVKDAKGFKVGDRVNVRLSRGEIIAQVKEVVAED